MKTRIYAVPAVKGLKPVKHSSIVLWPIPGIQSSNDPCYIYFLITMTYFVKVTRFISTDYTLKNIVNAKMTHHINKLYVIISYFLC